MTKQIEVNYEIERSMLHQIDRKQAIQENTYSLYCSFLKQELLLFKIFESLGVENGVNKENPISKKSQCLHLSSEKNYAVNILYLKWGSSSPLRYYQDLGPMIEDVLDSQDNTLQLVGDDSISIAVEREDVIQTQVQGFSSISNKDLNCGESIIENHKEIDCPSDLGLDCLAKKFSYKNGSIGGCGKFMMILVHCSIILRMKFKFSHVLYYKDILKKNPLQVYAGFKHKNDNMKESSGIKGEADESSINKENYAINHKSMIKEKKGVLNGGLAQYFSPIKTTRINKIMEDKLSEGSCVEGVIIGPRALKGQKTLAR